MAKQTTKNEHLDEIDDKNLVENIKNEHDDASLRELMTRHTGLYMSMINKIIDDSNQTLKQDIYDQRAYNFYKFALDYDPEKKMSFSTYLGERTKFLCFLSRKRAIRDSHSEINESIPSDISTVKPIEMKDSLQDIVSMIDKNSDERFKEIVNIRFFSRDGLAPWEVVAEKTGLSIEGARKIYNKNIAKIRKRLK